MKKITFIILSIALCMFISCGPSAYEKAKEKENPTSTSIDFKEDYSEKYTIIKIDNCEYIKGWSGYSDGGPFLTHKGNCTNPIHAYIKPF